jgi:hypothetical protein
VPITRIAETRRECVRLASMGRHRPHARIALALATTATFACSLLVPFSEYDSAPRGDIAPDASEAAPPVGPTAGDAARLCEGPHWICDDFDREGGAFDPRYWTAVEEGAGADIRLSSSTFSSPPQSARFEVNLDGSTARLIKEATGAPVRGFSCSFRVRVDRRPAKETSVFGLSLQGTATAGGYHIYLFLLPSSNDQGSYWWEISARPDGGELKQARFVESIRDGAWRHVTVEHTGTALRMTVDGTLVEYDSGTDLSLVELPDTTVSVGMTGARGGWAINVDDVICDRR